VRSTGIAPSAPEHDDDGVTANPAITASGLGRTFTVPVKGEGPFATLKHFVKRQTKDIAAVTDVSFTIAAGERVGFLGRNGAGKTTTLKMLSGLLLPTTGSVSVLGHEPFHKEAAFLKRIALVMGNKAQLMWDLPAKESLRLQASIYGVADDVWRPRVAELTSLLGLQGLLDQPVRKLSLGERMKAELMCALLHRPELLFLDEPTLGLDVNAQAAVRTFLKHYNETTGASLLLTSHYMADITALCSRVIIIHDGRLRFDGDLKGLLTRLAPEKRIELELRDVVTDEAVSRAVSAVTNDDRCQSFRHASSEGRLVRFLVSPHALAPSLSLLLQTLDPVDLSVTDPPIDDVIGRALDGDIGDAPQASAP